MLNYRNLTDDEYEYLCCDIMSKKLNKSLRRFGKGRDGGIDLTDNVITRNIVVQVKHFWDSNTSQLISALRNEIPKVRTINPKSYYICCSKNLTPQNVKEIYLMFEDYMESEENIITLNEIEDFLTDSENEDILRKHYKLWIDSTGILQQIYNNDIFVDCEALLSDIEREKKLFVQTEAYECALESLEHNKTLFITGNPGVGKTITSKMLTLYYAANGYRVRYTTNGGDLAALKKSLSANRDAKEIILVDDCFGQAYFQMRESQNRELLALIKYVNLSKNKYLILNSRVTIYMEAKEREPELIRSFDNNEYKVFVMDMTCISKLEKARILYNHLYFSDIPPEYFAQIKKDKRYRKIINHANYNPRLIEFVTSSSRYKSVCPEDYYKYIMYNLSNPKEIWKDEYERRLQKSDRILLITIYSLSDKASSLNLVRKCFEKRIMAESDIDKTVNQFDSSLQRLMDGFVHIIDENGKKKISMVNPSVNDYLDGLFEDNLSEKQAVVSSACCIMQLVRMLSNAELEEYARKMITEHRIDDYCFLFPLQKGAFTAYLIGENKICDSFYRDAVHEYLMHPISLRISFDLYRSDSDIVCTLFHKDLAHFYNLREFLMEAGNLEEFFEVFRFRESIRIVCAIEYLFEGEERERFIERITQIIKSSIRDHCSEIDLWTMDLDVASAVDWSYYEDEYGNSYGRNEAIQRLEEEAREETCKDIECYLKKLPQDIALEDDFLDYVEFEFYGGEAAIQDYFESFMPDSDTKPLRISSYDDEEIDYIFDRDM